jgi:Na+-driven multidrug efflux pump
VFDGAFGVAGGVLRGCGRLRELAEINVAMLWGVGVAGGLVATFPLGLKLPGVWLGLAAGVASGGLATLCMVCNLNWPAEAARAAHATAALTPALPSLTSKRALSIHVSTVTVSR